MFLKCIEFFHKRNRFFFSFKFGISEYLLTVYDSVILFFISIFHLQLEFSSHFINFRFKGLIYFIKLWQFFEDIAIFIFGNDFSNHINSALNFGFFQFFNLRISLSFLFFISIFLIFDSFKFLSFFFMLFICFFTSFIID